MEEESKGAVELNENEQQRKTLENAQRELYKIESKLQSLDLPKGFRIVSISKYKEMKVSKQIAEKDVYEVELQNEKSERKIQLYRQLDEERLMLIGTINETDKIVLDSDYKDICMQRYKGYISDNDLEMPYQIDSEKLEEKKEAQIEAGKEKDQSNDKTIQEMQIAMKLGVPSSQILNVVEIKDTNTMSNVLDKNLKPKKIYAVKLKSSAGKITSNEWVMMEEKEDGTYERAMREDKSDTLQNIGHELGIRNSVTNDTIENGQINAMSNPNAEKGYVELRRHRFSDGNTYLLEIDKVREAELHVYKEENGKIEPLCTNKHQTHKQEKVELPDRELEVEEDERTPWGDAEARRRSY